MIVRYLFFIFLLVLNFNLIKSSKLNVPRVLLPVFNDININFTLFTREGCYKWSTTGPEIIQLIQANPDECSDRVIISPISKEMRRSTAIVLAEEVNSGIVIRCDVIVDIINSLSIVTNTRELFLEEAPVAFEVRAIDDQGNEFTTLEGVEMKWNLNFPSKVGQDNILRFISFKESPYKAPSAVQYFDEQGLQGHIVLLEGVKTGSAKISVELLQKEYSHVPACEVSLMVVANLLLIPSEVYITKGTTIKFKIMQMHHNKMEQIHLPDGQYYLEVLDQYIATANIDGSVKGIDYGKSRILLHDRNVDENDANIKLPSAIVNVVDVDYLKINLLPNRNWNTLIDECHQLQVDMYTANNHKIFQGDNTKIIMSIDNDYFEVFDQTINGSWTNGVTTQIGVTSIHAALQNTRISAQADLYIHSQFNVHPTHVYLPWDPVVKPKYDIKLKATGGDGNYIWGTNDASIALVTHSGFVKTQTSGSATISVAMSKNHNIQRFSKFYIIPAKNLKIIEHVMESEINKSIYLQVSMFGVLDKNETLVPFTNCQKLPFNVKIKDQNFIYNQNDYNATLIENSCAVISITGKTVGTTKVTVSYKTDDTVLEDTVTVSTFQPLKVTFPQNRQIVLPVGSSMNVTLKGGPISWSSTVENRRIFKVGEESLITIRDATELYKQAGEPDQYTLTVLCKKLGFTNVEYIVRNTPIICATCPNYTSQIKLNVICGKPRSITLLPFVDVKAHASCPMDLSGTKIATNSFEPIDLEIIIKDDKLRRFNNITSLNIVWSLQPANFAHILQTSSVIESTNELGNIIIPNTHYQTIKPYGKHGIVDIKATVVGYNTEMLNRNAIESEWPVFIDTNDTIIKKPLIEATLSLVLVDSSLILPEKITIFNHPKNKFYLTINQGSGHYEINLSNKGIADINYASENKRQLIITPKSVGDTRLTIIDLCITSKPINVLISVVSVAKIKIEMYDRVEIDKSITCAVKFFDNNDELLPLPSLELLEINYYLTNNILGVNQATKTFKTEWGLGEVRYTIAGLELGDTKITFSTGRGHNQIYSSPINVQVFPPLKILPRNSTLIIGSIFQLEAKGGPHPDANVEYKILDSSIADVSLNGIIEAKKIGNSRIVGQSIGINQINGKRVVYSQDTVDLYVVPLLGIKIISPMLSLTVGNTMPIWANGIPDEINPLILGSTKIPIDFNWSLSSEENVELLSPFQPASIHYSSENQISIRLHGLNPGRVTLSLNVTFPLRLKSVACSSLNRECSQKKVAYSTSLEFQIVEDFYLVTPPVHTEEILMGPNSVLQLVTNLDTCSTCRKTYSIDSYSISGDVATPSTKALIENKLITVSDTGLVKSYSKFGRAVVTITQLSDHQSISVAIQVKPVHYLIMETSTKLEDGKYINAIPKGVSLELIVNYFDKNGDKFKAVNSQIQTQLSRNDLVRLITKQNSSSVFVKFKKIGNTVLKLFAENSKGEIMMDFVKFHVDNLIAPIVDKITEGDVVCYQMMPFSDNGSKRWGSTNSEYLEIDAATGVGVAKKSQYQESNPISVTYTIHSGFVTSTEVQILPIDSITIIFENEELLDNDGMISNPYKGHFQDVELVLKSSVDHSEKFNNLITPGTSEEDMTFEQDSCNFKDSNLIFQDYPFSCSLKFTDPTVSMSHNINDLFTVTPYFNFLRGRYSCRVTTNQTPDFKTTQINSNITLFIQFNNGILKRIWFNFIPGVHIDLSELYINEMRRKGQLTIQGREDILKKLELKALDESVFSISKPIEKSSISYQYQIKLLYKNWKLKDFKSETFKLYVFNKLTGHKIEIPVRTTLEQHHNSENLIGSQLCSESDSEWNSFLMRLMWEYKYLFFMVFGICSAIIISYQFTTNYLLPNVYIRYRRNLPVSPQVQTATLFNRQHPYNGNISTWNNQSLNTSRNFSDASNLSRRSQSPNFQKSMSSLNQSTFSQTRLSSPLHSSIYGDPNSSIR